MSNISVLIVDDEHEFLDTIVKRMRKRGITCEGVDNGLSAIERIKKGDIDVVLLDVRMPGLDGVETLREIKCLKPLIEVVMLTGHASVESGIEGMNFGAFDYLMKPMEFEMLLEKLQDAYQRKAIQEEKILLARSRKS